MAKWIKLGTQIISHERFLAAKADGRDLYVWGMAHTGFHERDGFLSTIAVETSAWGAGTAKGNMKLAERLVKVGLWARAEDGFTVVKWVEQGNATKAQLEETREKWSTDKADKAAKKAALKAAAEAASANFPPGKLSGSPGDSLTLNSYSSGSCSESRSPEPDPARATPANDTDVTPWSVGTPGIAARERFEQAVAKAIDGPFALDRAFWHQETLCDLLNAHAKGQPKAAALDWLAKTVGEWVTSEGTSVSGWEPKGLLRWLNAKRPPRSQSGKRGTGGGPRGDRQGLDNWKAPQLTGTDDEFPFGRDT